jgi:hypothetical protein
VNCHGPYHGLDLSFYGHFGGLEDDFILHPRSDFRRVPSEMVSDYSVRSALIGSTLAARPAGTALAANATAATPATASR